MNKNTLLYGLLVASGLLAYFSWKKKSANSVSDSELASDSTSGAFVNDVPVSQEAVDILQGTGGIKAPLNDVKDSSSQIIDPFISETKQAELAGQKASY